MDAIDVRELLDHPGTSRRVRASGPLPGLRTEMAVLPEDATVEADLLIEGVVEGVYVRGTVAAPMRLTCARCIVEFDRTVSVDIGEMVARDPGPEDDYRLADDLTLDPEPILRDALGLELPFAPLCRPDCRGLCPTCGADRNESPCACPEGLDPRWAALEGFGDDRPVPL